MHWVFLLFTVWVSFSHAEIDLTITGANVRKAKIAIGNVHPLSSSQDLSLQKRIRDEVLSDIELTNLFEILNSQLFLKLDTPGKINTISYGQWASASASFVLRMGYEVRSGKLTLEANFFDANGEKRLFGTRYQYAVDQYYRVVHALTEDILRVMVGERGLFHSRILMSCRSENVRRNPPSEIYIVDPDGRNFKRLTYDKTIAISPSWSPDGNLIAYTQWDWIISKGKRIKGIALKQHDLRTGKRVILSAADGMKGAAAWSPDGSQIALTMSLSGRPEIYFMDPKNPSHITPFSRNIQWQKIGGGFQKTDPSLLFEVEPSWSPDGKKLVISSARTRHPMIYVVDIATKVASQLTFAGTYNSSPAWSPKGDKIMFAAQRLIEGNFDLFLIDPDGNNLKQITSGDRPGRRPYNNEKPSWAPTGRHLVFESNEFGHDAVFITTNDGSIRRQISPKKMWCKTPSWGPVEN